MTPRRPRLAPPTVVAIVLLSLAPWFSGCDRQAATQRRLEFAQQQLERNWRAWIEPLTLAVAPLAASGDVNAELQHRQQALGNDGGIAIYAASRTQPAQWTGWTSVLRDPEWSALVTPSGSTPAWTILRRGLERRLVVARRQSGGTVWVAERALAAEPALGPLGVDLPRGIEARSRWYSLGEGIRLPAPSNATGSRAREAWIALSPEGAALGRVSLVSSRVTESTGLITGARLGVALWWLALLAVRWPTNAQPQRRASRPLRLLAVALVGLSLWFVGVDLMGAQHLIGELAPSSPVLWLRLVQVIEALGPALLGATLWHAAGPTLPAWRLAAAAALACALPALVMSIGAASRVARNNPGRWGDEIVGREAIWRDAINSTLAELADVAADPDRPTRAAIDVWWRSALAQRGLIGGVWHLDAGGGVIDQFLTGLPPLLAPRVTTSAPTPVNATLLGVRYPLLVASQLSASGERWTIAVLDDPSNIPGRARLDPLRGLLAPAIDPLSPEIDPRTGPLLVVYDSTGAARVSDLDAPPALPATTTAEIEHQGRRFAVWTDSAGDGVVAVLTPYPTVAALVATFLGWVLAGTLALLAACLLLELLLRPRALLRRSTAAWRALRRTFRVQVAVALLVAGLLPLLVLAIAGRAVAKAQAKAQLTSEAARAVASGARLLNDFLTLQDARVDSERTELDEVTASWLARTLGQDLFVWREGRLIATNRGDLVRAGRVSERLAGAAWRQLDGGVALLIDQQPARPGVLERELTVAHGPFLEPSGSVGVVSLALTDVGRRAEQGLVEVDRALLISAALLTILAGLLIASTTRRFARPLHDLQTATTRLAAGDFDAPVPETGYEETRALSRAFRDMAASLKAQQRTLQARAAAIEALIASMPLAVLATRSDGTIAATNPRAQSLLGVSPDRLLSSDGTPLAQAALRASRQHGPSQETVASAQGEGTRHFRVSGLDLPGLNEPSDAARLVVLEDLTDTVRSERLVAWAEMARRIAHEIKNPLTPISLMVDHIKRLVQKNDPSLPAVLSRALETISDQVRVLRDTARDFSDYARLLVAHNEPVDLAARVPEWIAPYRLAPPPGVEVDCQVTPQPLVLPTDVRLLRRALINLVDNALVAVEAGGRVEVSVRGDTANEAVRVAVRDNGPGIAVSKRARLFEPDVTTRETGSGLGLPIVQEAVAALGGRIEVESAPGQGACFTIVLPWPIEKG